MHPHTLLAHTPVLSIVLIQKGPTICLRLQPDRASSTDTVGSPFPPGHVAVIVGLTPVRVLLTAEVLARSDVLESDEVVVALLEDPALGPVVWIWLGGESRYSLPCVRTWP